MQLFHSLLVLSFVSLSSLSFAGQVDICNITRQQFDAVVTLVTNPHLTNRGSGSVSFPTTRMISGSTDSIRLDGQGFCVMFNYYGGGTAKGMNLKDIGGQQKSPDGLCVAADGNGSSKRIIVSNAKSGNWAVDGENIYLGIHVDMTPENSDIGC